MTAQLNVPAEKKGFARMDKERHLAVSAQGGRVSRPGTYRYRPPNPNLQLKKPATLLKGEKDD